jgi:hypothetical protein
MLIDEHLQKTIVSLLSANFIEITVGFSGTMQFINIDPVPLVAISIYWPMMLQKANSVAEFYQQQQILILSATTD